jgi:hypothetical protein
VTRLNQIIAIEKGVKADALRTLTDLHRRSQTLPILTGIARTYLPKDDDGDQLPPESTRVQVRLDDVLTEMATALTRLFDVVATKDNTNRFATADVIVGGETLLTDVPATTLLFLEKQLDDIATFVRKLATLDPAEAWNWDAARNCWATTPTQTTRTKKIPRNHVKAEATDKHPAQVEVWTEDVVVGYWTTTKFSGALPASRVVELANRVTALREAVKKAREEANVTEARDVAIGAKIFGYLFA